jgi:integrase/recombinase XerD
MAIVFGMRTRFTAMAEFARETGMRQEEIAALTHGQVDRQRNAASLTNTKGRRAREVPLSPAALAIVDRQPQFLNKPWVFWRGAEGARFKNVASQWRATVRRIDRAAQKAAQRKGTASSFKPFRFHDLRHLFAVEYLRERRGSIYDLQQILGHASVKTTEGYLDFLTPDEKKAAIHGTAQIGARDQRSANGSSSTL